MQPNRTSKVSTYRVSIGKIILNTSRLAKTKLFHTSKMTTSSTKSHLEILSCTGKTGCGTVCGFRNIFPHCIICRRTDCDNQTPPEEEEVPNAQEGN